MILLRGTFWGLFLWGLVSLLLPTPIFHAVSMVCGQLFLIIVLSVAAMFLFDWMETKYGD